MARILYAWELGGGYGHIMRMDRVAGALMARGHSLTLAVRNLQRAGGHAEWRDVEIVQAPYAPDMGGRLPMAINYADILLRCGYATVNGLSGLVRGWLTLFKYVRPELVLTDHAPTAQFAARIAGLPATAIGTGFFVPPGGAPMASLQPWQEIAEADLAKKDERALAAMNGVLQQFGTHINDRPLERVADLYNPEVDVLCTFAEFDHYGPRDDGGYFGPMFQLGGDTDEPWADMPEPRVFVYLNAVGKGFARVMQELVAAGFSTLVHARDIAPDKRRALESDRIRFAPKPLDLAWVAQHAKLVVCHGGPNTCSAVVLRGLPLLVFPEHLEQTLSGYRFTRQGVGLMQNPLNKKAMVQAALDKLVNEASFAEKARALADKYAGFDFAGAAASIAAHCEAGLAARVAQA